MNLDQLDLSPMPLKRGCCPSCGVEMEWEPCALMPKVVPVCDPCSERQHLAIAEKRQADAWSAKLHERMDANYRSAIPERVKPALQPVLSWRPRGGHPGGIGLIAESGLGKSCALACLIKELKTPFLWWSGTEARDAHLESVMADKDRDGARRRWDHGSSVPLLVLDDVSQGKMTETWSSALFGLLEARTAANLPIFWTCQIPLTEFRAKIFRQNEKDMAQAEAITRRLAHQTLIIRG